MTEPKSNFLLGWPNDWAKLWALVAVVNLWLGVVSLPFYLRDVRTDWLVIRAGFSDAQNNLIVDSLGALICAGALLAVILFHRRHPRFLIVAIALSTVALVDKCLGYWLLPAPYWMAPDGSGGLWLTYFGAAAICAHVAFILFAIRSRTLRQRLQNAAHVDSPDPAGYTSG